MGCVEAAKTLIGKRFFIDETRLKSIHQTNVTA
jgi:hypothetical protein